MGMSLHYGPPLNRSPRLHGSATRQPTFLSSGTSVQHSAAHLLLTRYGTATAFANPVLAQVGGPLSRLPAQRRGKEAKCLIHGKDTHTSRERSPAPQGRLSIRMDRGHSTHSRQSCPLRGGASHSHESSAEDAPRHARFLPLSKGGRHCHTATSSQPTSSDAEKSRG